MTPKQNPFYLALPYDDLNDRVGAAARKRVIHWANKKPWSTMARDKNTSIMKDRWVKIYRNGRICYGQVQDAGPGKYHNGGYVFSKANRRPANKRYNGSGMDVSPALNGCLRFSEINGQDDTVSWRFVEAKDVPSGPWKKIVTTTKW